MLRAGGIRGGWALTSSSGDSTELAMDAVGAASISAAALAATTVAFLNALMGVPFSSFAARPL
jgi:hypothetical protein